MARFMDDLFPEDILAQAPSAWNDEHSTSRFFTQAQTLDRPGTEQIRRTHEISETASSLQVAQRHTMSGPNAFEIQRVDSNPKSPGREQPHFLTLPVELRSMIYRILFEDSYIVMSEPDLGKGVDTFSTTNSDILLTCRFCYEEGRPALAATTVYFLDGIRNEIHFAMHMSWNAAQNLQILHLGWWAQGRISVKEFLSGLRNLRNVSFFAGPVTLDNFSLEQILETEKIVDGVFSGVQPAAMESIREAMLARPEITFLLRFCLWRYGIDRTVSLTSIAQEIRIDVPGTSLPNGR